MSEFAAPIQSTGPEGVAAPEAPPAALRSALVGAIDRRRWQLRWRAAIAGAVSVAIAAVLLGGGVFAGGPDPVLAIDEGNEWVRVQILNGDAGAAEMTRELQEAGIDGEVKLVPAAPQFVAHWMGIAQTPACGEGCAGLANTDAGFDGNVFQIRRDAIYKLSETSTILYVGREAEAGETPRDFPPREYDLRVLPLGGQGDGAKSWAQALNPIRVQRDGSN
jgi:hypothetical protein